MSMHEALRPLRGIVDWLKGEPEEVQAPPPLPTALEDARGLVEIVNRGGLIDRQSPTWNGVAKWAANELLDAHAMLEVAEGEGAATLRASCKTLRDLLAVNDRRDEPEKIEDFGPDVP
jgi:hypothetical protein